MVADYPNQSFSAARVWVSAAYFVAFALCFVFRSSYSSASAAIALAGLGGLVFGRLNFPLSEVAKSWCKVLLIYVIVLLLLRVLTTEDLRGRHFEGLLRYLLAIPMLWAMWTWRPKQSWFIFSLCAGLVVGFAIVFVARVIKGQGIYSGYGHQLQIQYSDMMTIMAAAAAMMSFAYRRLSFTWWALHLCVLLGIAGALLTGGRGGLLVIVPTLICYLWATERRYRLATVGYLFLSILLSAFAISLMPQLGIIERFTSIWVDITQFQQGNSYSSQGGRLEMWQCSWQLFSQHTWLGTGVDLIAIMNQAADNGQCHAVVKGFTHVHNDFLDMFVKYGIVGGSVMLLMYLYPCYRYLCQLLFYPQRSGDHRSIAWTGLAVCLGFYACSMSNAILTHNITLTFFLLFNAWFITGLEKGQR